MKKSDKTSHILWMELLHQKSMSNFSKSSESNKINDSIDGAKTLNNSKCYQYKSQEEYYDEVLLLKKNIIALKGENEILKSKLRQSDESVIKKDKELNEVLNSIENQSNSQNSSIKNFINVKKLQQTIFRLKSEIKNKDAEILMIKNDIKNTKISELKTENELYLQEIKSLKHIHANFSSTPSRHSSRTPNSQNQSQKSDKYASLIHKNKELMKQNKVYKKEQSKMKQNELKKAETTDSDKNKVEHKACTLEINRLKSQIVELTDDKNEIKTKFENSCSKYKVLEDQYGKTLNEFETLKIKYDKLSKNSAPKNEMKPKDSKMQSVKENVTNNDKTIKIIESTLMAYLSREQLLQEFVKIKSGLNKEDCIASVLQGYVMREISLK